MESEYRKGYVYIQNHFSGIIAETEEGYIFTYDQDWEQYNYSIMDGHVSAICGTEDTCRA